MKTFTTAEIRDLLNQVCREAISFSRMVEIMNKRVSDADKPCVEDIPVRKFKKGDKVRIKEGVSSKTHCDISPGFVEEMDKLIERELIVENCSKSDFVKCDGYYFSEDWLEPYEELKKGDLAIFWHFDKTQAVVRLFDNEQGDVFQNPIYVDNTGHWWSNAIKFESKEQYERLINGEILKRSKRARCQDEKRRTQVRGRVLQHRTKVGSGSGQAGK